MKLKIVFLLVILVFSTLSVGLVHADSNDGISSYNPIPLVTPTPTFNPDATATPTPSNSSIVYVGADRVQNINPNGVPISLSTYNHTTVYLTYAEADSYNVNFTGASNSFHNEQQSTTQMSVVIDGIGTYHFTFTVLYNQITDQPVTLSVYSGDGTPNTLSFACVNRGFTLDMVINTKVLPEYPSASEIADAQYGMQKKMLQDVTQGQQNTNQFFYIIAGAVTLAVAIIGIVLFFVVRYLRKMAVRQLRSETYGYGHRG